MTKGMFARMKSEMNAGPNSSEPIAGVKIHSIKSRQVVLDDEIAFAQKAALSPNCATSVFCELVKLAEKQYGCLISVVDGEVKYQASGVIKFLSVRSLRKRLARAAQRDLH